jgi:fimbrial chaperone protein
LNRLLPAVLLAMVLLCFPSFSGAGSLRVVPTKLFLASGKKAGVLKVGNEGADKATIQVRAVKWAQDEDGKDVYEPTRDIALFPKIFTVEPGKEQLLRIGIVGKRTEAHEGAYRIFLEEIPVARPGESQLTLALRLSVPLFIKPVKEVEEWKLEGAGLSEGELVVRIANTGNSHVVVGKIRAKGADEAGDETFSHEDAGWYVLPGVTRAFKMKIPAKECRASSGMVVSAEVGRSSKNVTFNMDKALCPVDAEETTDRGKER